MSLLKSCFFLFFLINFIIPNKLSSYIYLNNSFKTNPSKHTIIYPI